jgi:hypothetical protein
MEWTNIIRNDLVTNKQLAVRGRALGFDACVIKDPGTAVVSDGMVATTFEAVIAAVYVDSGADTLDVVHGVVANLGFFTHYLFTVTYCDSPALVLTDIQMIINMRCLDPS